MAAVSSIIAVAALAVGTASYVSAEQSRKEAKANYASSAAEQGKARSEQEALNKQRAMLERRQQIREARVRQGKLEQASENTGVAGSSGEFGAGANLATQLGANIGTNLGQLAGAARISQFSQNAADFGSSAQNNLNDSAQARDLFGLSTNIFNAAGGFNTLKTAFNSPMPKG